MRGAVLPIAAAALLSACATTDTQRTAAGPPRNDYSHLSCREIAAELALTERAVVSGARRQPLAREGETAQAYLFPASLGPAAPAASAFIISRTSKVPMTLHPQLGAPRRGGRRSRYGSIRNCSRNI